MTRDWSVPFLILLSVCLSLGTTSCGGGPVNNAASLSVSTASLPNGVVGSSYSAMLQATGGVPPLTWSLSGTLPYGLSLSKAGAITGMPAFAGTSSSLFFQVTDSTGNAANATLIIIVSPEPPPPSVVTNSLPTGTVGTAYSWAVQATGGTTPYTWELQSGTLPPGLSLNTSTGAITGTPTTAGTYANLIFQVSDATGLTAVSKSLTIIVDPA
jgi:hypothetical protein